MNLKNKRKFTISFRNLPTFNSSFKTRSTPVIQNLFFNQVSVVNVVSSSGNKYVFNGSTTYTPNTVYKLNTGRFVLKGFLVNIQLLF